MKQAVLVTAYTNISHLYTLIDSLSSDYIFYIHIDKKSDISDRDFEKLSCKKNVALVSSKYKVNWGSINHLKAILFLLEKSFEDAAIEYFHLITGHDFPIKSSSEITSFLEKSSGKDFFEYNKLPYNKWDNGGYDRILYYNLYDCFNGRNGWKNAFIKKFISLQKALGLKRKFPTDFPDELYGGSTYWSLSRKSVEYILDFTRNNKWYLQRFKYTFCSEEIFFQTLLLNSPLRDKAVNDNKRYIVWEERNGNFPANLDESDYNNIAASDAFFARKFDPMVSSTLIKKIKDKNNIIPL